MSDFSAPPKAVVASAAAADTGEAVSEALRDPFVSVTDGPVSNEEASEADDAASDAASDVASDAADNVEGDDRVVRLTDPFETLQKSSPAWELHKRAVDALLRLQQLEKVVTSTQEDINPGGLVAVAWNRVRHTQRRRAVTRRAISPPGDAGPGDADGTEAGSGSSPRSPGTAGTALDNVLRRDVLPAVGRWQAAEFDRVKRALADFLPEDHASRSRGGGDAPTARHGLQLACAGGRGGLGGVDSDADEEFLDVLGVALGDPREVPRAMWCTRQLGGDALLDERLGDCRALFWATRTVLRGEAPGAIALLHDAGLSARPTTAVAPGDARAWTAPLSPVVAGVAASKWMDVSRIAVVAVQRTLPGSALLDGFGDKDSVLTAHVYSERFASVAAEQVTTVGSGAGHGYHFNVPVPEDGGDFSANAALAARSILKPVLDEFRPDLVMLVVDAMADDAALQSLRASLVRRPYAGIGGGATGETGAAGTAVAADTVSEPAGQRGEQERRWIAVLHSSAPEEEDTRALSDGFQRACNVFGVSSPNGSPEQDGGGPGSDSGASPAWVVALKDRLSSTHDEWRSLYS